MSLIDPRNPDRIPVEPTRLDGGRRADLDPPTDPRIGRSTSGNWGMIGGLAAVLVFGLIIFSMIGGQPAGNNATTQASQPAPTAQPGLRQCAQSAGVQHPGAGPTAPSLGRATPSS
ncbi:hypothetical protein [Phreatobacter sp.]|uniref:hypothetical protein n=1 Tax=Phreatobacter sp. TaxID=1966341 RepID=UPI0022BF685B|nr:hypothetical protein [Phreatobacter sp.]MCZ8314613.1 hypothetical protein [Phreatobacter sp.]